MVTEFSLEVRRKLLAERILWKLAHSPAHEHLGALARIELAYQQADEILSQPGEPDTP